MRASTPRLFSTLLPLPALVVVLTTTACWQIDIPEGARIGCTADEQCPDGFACREELGGLCVEIRPDDQTAPSLVSASSSVTPSTARIGTTITATLVSNEKLLQAPAVTLIGVDGPRGFDSVVDDDGEGLRFTATTVVLASDGAGVRDVRAQLIDLVGNVTPEAAVGRVTVDSVAPVVAELSVAPANANADVDVVVTLRTDEAVGDATTATLVDGRAFALDPAGADPLVRTFRLRPDPSTDREGAQAVNVVVSDVAGNLVDKTNSDLAFDFTAPKIVGDAVFSRSVVTVGQVVGLALTADESIGDITVRLVAIDDNGDDALDDDGNVVTLPLAIDGRSGRDVQLRHEVGVDDVEGRYRVDVVRLVDLAGNASTALAPAGLLTIDRGAPVFVEAPTSSPAVLSRQPGNDVVTVGFVLDAAADVVVQVGPTIVPCTSEGTGTVRYSCVRAVADGDVDGVFGVTVTAIDGAGNVAFAAAPGIVADFTAPSLVLSVVPDRQARAGEVISLSAVANEVLASGSVVVSSTLAFTPAVVQGRSATSTFTVPPGLQGSFTADVVAADEGGNVTAAPTSITVQIDGVAPSIVSSSLSTPRVAPNQSFTLTFRASELLGSDPQVTFTNGDATATMTKVSGPDADRQYEYRGTGPATGTNQFYTITVVMADVAGNPGADSPAVVVVDNTAPRLAGFDIAPLAARADDTVRVVVTADETMREPPTIVATNGAASLTFTPTDTTSGQISYVFTTRVTPALAQGTWTFSSFTLTDQAGNSGGVTPTGQRTFSVDSQAPTVTITAPAVGTRLSTNAGSNTVTTTFSLSEALPLSAVRVTLGERATNNCANTTTTTYSCSFTIVAADGEGSRSITVQATDAAGNVGTASRIVELDFSPPVVIASAVRLRPGVGNPLTNVSTARAGTLLDVDVTFNEPLRTAPTPTLSSTPAVGSFTVANNNPTFTFSTTVTGGNGTATFSVVAVDSVGNTATLTLPSTLLLDSTAPTTPAVATPDRIVFTRQPWGTNANATPAFSLDGAAGSVDADSTVIAYANVAGTAEITRGVATGTTFSLSLPIADRPDVFVAAVDAAGNRSAVVKVKDVRWTATMRGKIVGSTVENPHTFESRAVSERAREQDNGVERPNNVAASDGITEDATAVPSFTELVADVGNGHVAFDPYRDVALMPGGPTGMLEWNGSRWTAVRVRDPEDDGMPDFTRPFEVAFDLERAELVFVGSSNDDGETWIYNGDSWRLADAGDSNNNSAPGPRTSFGMAWDDNARQVTLFGGQASVSQGNGCGQSLNECFADTWVWTSQEWINIDDNGGPAARQGPAMAWDPVRGMIVLFGGRNPSGVFNDTWLWDGGWSRLTTSGTPPARERARLVFHDRLNTLVMQGGADINDADLGTAFQLTGASWSTFDVGLNPPPPTTSGHDIDYDAARDQLLLVSGRETWVRGTVAGTTSWRRVSAVVDPFDGAPPARANPGLAFDPLRQRMVMYGGATTAQSSTALCDTSGFGRCGDLWDFDGARWTARSLSTAAPNYPGRRSDAGMAIDTTTGNAWLYGGVSTSPCDGASGTACDGIYRIVNPAGTTSSTSTRFVPATRPPARSSAGVAYDPVNRRVLVHGGRNGVNNNFSDFWAFSTTSNSWSQLCTSAACISSGPGARAQHKLVWDSVRNLAVLYGGGGTNPNDVYEFNHITNLWTRRPSTGDTPNLGRTANGFSFDAARNRFVLFGDGPLCFTTGERNDCGTLFEWNPTGAQWTRIDATSSPAGDGRPSRRTGVSMVYDPTRREHLLVGADNSVGTFESWRYTSAADQRPGQMFVVDFGAARATGATLMSVAVAWRATGNLGGFTITSARDGRRQVITSTAALTPTTVTATVTTNVAALLTPTNDFVFWADANASIGTGPTPSRLSTDAVESTVVYRLP